MIEECEKAVSVITVSVIIPARNEEALVGQTLQAALKSAMDSVGDVAGHGAALPHLSGTGVEIIVVDNSSSDRTREVVGRYARDQGVRLESCLQLKAPCARNCGARLARGRLLVFVDADTVMPPDTLRRVCHLCDNEGYQAGITRLAPLDEGHYAWCWWLFWNHVRRLPLARAKAMPALMFCTREVFEEFGPFDEQVAIGEEWPILAELYRARPGRFIYDQTLIALTSNRRMEMQRFGYARAFLKYVWAVLHPSGRLHATDHLRHSR